MRTIIAVFVICLMPLIGGSVSVASDDVITEFEQGLKEDRLLPYETYRFYIDIVTKQFRGNVVGSDGKKIDLPEGRDPSMPIIIEQLSFIVVDRALISGLALACDIEWIEYFMSFMQSLRRIGLLTEIQMAFIVRLHWIVQADVGEAFDGKCDDNIRRFVVQGIALAPKND